MNRDYTWLSGVRTALLSHELVDPPEWLRNNARELFRQRTQSLVERVRAVLVFDSRNPGLAHVGVRAITVAEGPWQLLYRGDDVDIDLLVRPNQDGRTTSVRGQALNLSGSSIAAGVVVAVPTDQPRPIRGEPMPSARSELESSGEFALSNLQRGRYDVVVRFGAREIELSGVEL
jgi:hypothetical protein